MRLLRATGGTGAAGGLVALLTEHVARHGVGMFPFSLRSLGALCRSLAPVVAGAWRDGGPRCNVVRCREVDVLEHAHARVREGADV